MYNKFMFKAIREYWEKGETYKIERYMSLTGRYNEVII